jgi:UDP-N-acetylmuramyl pentapeptide phosphotransferase/UDP-N-acetylglucosamine-1-phosphate transferase
MYINFILFTIILLFINIILKKNNFLVDNPGDSFHKIEKKAGTPLSGGLYIIICLLIISMQNSQGLIDHIFLLQISPLIILGIFSDTKKDFAPSLRMILQLSIILLFLLFNFEILITETNITIIDYFLDNKLISFGFTIFCIITFLNGLNFIDGINGLVSGYLFFCILTLYLIFNQNTFLIDQTIFKLLEDALVIYIIFFAFNLFGKLFFGDNGIYTSAIIVSFIVISFVKSHENISPILAVSLLWYPAYENLFTIIRRLKSKKNPYYPDRLHLHSLIYRFLISKKNFVPKKYCNSFTGILMNLFLIPNFIFAYFFYNKSLFLGTIVIIYVLCYSLIYNHLIKNYK